MKMAIYFGAGAGGLLGGYLPVLLWNASALDVSSLLGGFIGTLIGLWAGYKIGKYYDL